MTALKAMHSDMGDVKHVRKRKDSRKQAIAYADKMFSAYIKAKDQVCVTCGASGPLDCSHVFRRSHYATRWHSDNAYAQCRSCHYKHHNRSEYPLIAYATTKIGADKMKILEAMSRFVSKFSAADIVKIGQDYAHKLEAMK